MELVEEHIEANRPRLARLITTAAGDATALPSLLNVARKHAGCLAVAQPQSDELCHALRIGARAASAVFALAAASDEVEVDLGGNRTKLRATGPTDSTDVGYWRAGCWLAYIVRDRPSIQRLTDTPVTLLRRSSTRGDECQYLFAEAFQAFARRTNDWSARLRAALDATDPERISLQDEEFVLNVLVPEMEILFRLALAEPGPFNEALQFALERHKKYWSKGKRKQELDGYLALGPLAIAGMAHDAGIPVEVDSKYMPARLVEGGCREH